MDDELAKPYVVRLAGMVDDLNAILDAHCAVSTIMRVFTVVEHDPQQLITLAPVTECVELHRRCIQAWVAIKTILQHSITCATAGVTARIVRERSDLISLALAEVERVLDALDTSLR